MNNASLTPLLRALERVEAEPDQADAWSDLGEAFLADGKPEGADGAFREALRRDGHCESAWAGLAGALRSQGRRTQACGVLERGLRVLPDSAGLWGALGRARWTVAALEGAAEAHRQAIARQPQELAHHANLANTLMSMGDCAGAIAVLDAVLQVMPDEPRLRTNRAMALLSSGQFAAGFAEHEARLRRPGVEVLPGPAWDGSTLHKPLLVIAEQGFGDAIQWARFLPRLAGRAPEVVLAAHPRLAHLLGQVPGVDRVVHRKAALNGELGETFGGVIALMSLPAVLGEDGSTLCEALPLWRPSAAAVDQWRDRIGLGLRVALAWSGNPAYAMDHIRSAPLHTLAPLGHVEGVRLFSIQKLHGVDALMRGEGPRGLLDLGPSLDRGPDAFRDTAAAMVAADIVVTTDTATAHLAGSLGCEAWLLLSRPADWRWGQEGTSCPWYPSMTVFRQPQTGDWSAVSLLVADALADRIASQT